MRSLMLCLLFVMAQKVLVMVDYGKKFAEKLALIPKASSKEKLIKPKNHYKYIDTCCCGITYKRHRINKFTTYSCPKCQQNLFVEKKNIVIYRDGKKCA